MNSMRTLNKGIGNVRKETENVKKLEMKNITTDVKNTLERINRLDEAEDQIREDKQPIRTAKRIENNETV